MPEEVFIVSCARTPIGSFRGSLSALHATDLGATAIKAAIERAGIKNESIEEVFMGHVLQASCGQAPARQAALKACLPKSVPCTTVNKVCASGLKSIILGAQAIKSGDLNVAICGGMESMSNVPYYLQRADLPYGGVNLVDGIVLDGLTDPSANIHMGNCTESLAKKYEITREQQDEFAIQSYSRSAESNKNGIFRKEIVPVTIPGKRGKPDLVIDEDEEFKKVDFDKMKKLNPVFRKDGGTITAANASSLNDGAAACVIMSENALNKFGCKPLAKIVSFADASVDPVDFGIAPSFAMPLALNKAGISKDDVDQWEINEAFSAVALANLKEMKLDESRVNIYGGAVSLGHPLGMSGARIVNSLAIQLSSGKLGMAGVCNGGGGASSLLLKKL